MKMDFNRGVWLAAACLTVVGVLWSVDTVRQARALPGLLQAKLAVRKQLDVMKRTMENQRAALQLYEALDRKMPPPLTEMIAAAFTNVTVDIKPSPPRPLTNGWLLYRSDVTFNELSLSLLPEFLRAAEMQRPPWCLQEFEISALPQKEGVGRVVLTLEAIGKPAGK